MGDSAATVRLVRCPKCENLLPELDDYAVYQCGGCGAVLRANKKRQEGDTLLEKSDKERVGGVCAKSDDSDNKGIVVLSDASDMDVKSGVGSLRCDQRDLEKENVKNAEVVRKQPKDASENWFVEDGVDMSMKRDELENASGREHGDLNAQFGPISASRRSQWMADWRAQENGEKEGVRRHQRTDVGCIRSSTSTYQDEGPSNYHLGSSCRGGEPLRKSIVPDEANRVLYLEHDRAELLKKLDELRDQLSRSCDMVDKPKEKAPVDGGMVPPDPYGSSDISYAGVSSGANRASMQYFGPGKPVTAHAHFNHFPEPFPYTNGHEMPMASFSSTMHNSNNFPRYGDPFGSHMHSGAPHPFPRQYQQPSLPYFSGQYAENNPDPFELYPNNASVHHPTCPCFCCYDNHRRGSVPVPPTAFHNKRFTDFPSSSMFHPENPGMVGPYDHNKPRTLIPPPFNVSQTHTRWPSDLNPRMGSFVHPRPERVAPTSGGRRCLPFSGGAPFVTCNNCFEILQLPKKVLLAEKNKQKVRCGACFTVIDFAVSNKKLVLSHAEAKKNLSEVNSLNEVVNDSTLHSHGHVTRIYAHFSSDDYDTSGYDFQSIDREPALPSTGPSSTGSKPHEMQSFHSSSPSTSEDDSIPEAPVPPKECTNSIQQPIKVTVSPPPAGSPLEEHFEFSSNNHVINRLGKGNCSSRSDQEKVKPNKVTSRQNSLKETSVATEMEVSFNDYSNTGVSQDSWDANKEEDQPRTNKGSDSFITNFIKKSFRDFSKSNQTSGGRSNVSVNGNLIPDRVLKKAEKMAGTVHPGQYWYDFRAGFWGVMGGPGLGIIPPFIEEFNYPMPQNCAAGDTGIFVNGRELHHKDLDLLSSRGLPTTRDRSYIIEISGRVLDEDTGEELDSLGKLAPTVEKVKRGFGMKLPRAAA
ncbi:protein ENHANCED DISEASE RESISTANCE 4-like [Pyrus x bretschneideri]|uniref:protein ENHANCED DISEASE RESISTANCE 4-like n=1 Tax=Pyrus x bretschneideri TaxID=225117 RepID=UPI00202E6166|nr:protein ENHANCED DISEASE RESISTANCE 4-like [Pyrus x bretschneideri]